MNRYFRTLAFYSLIIFSTNIAAANCYESASGGHYNWGTWGNTPSQVTLGPSGLSNSTWYSSYQFSFQVCTDTANVALRNAINMYPEEATEIREYYQNERNNCQSFITAQYKIYAGKFCD